MSHGKEDEDERKKLDANALNHLDVKDSDLVELENALLTEPLSYEDAREVEETHGFEIVPKDFETKESIFNSSPIDLLLLISRPNTVGDFQFAQMKILRKVSDAIRAYEEDQDLKEMLLQIVEVFDADRFGKEGGIKNSTTLMRATGGYEGPMLLYMTGMKKASAEKRLRKQKVRINQERRKN